MYSQANVTSRGNETPSTARAFLRAKPGPEKGARWNTQGRCCVTNQNDVDGLHHRTFIGESRLCSFRFIASRNTAISSRSKTPLLRVWEGRWGELVQKPGSHHLVRLRLAFDTFTVPIGKSPSSACAFFLSRKNEGKGGDRKSVV